jgi:hypothetical protein
MLTGDQLALYEKDMYGVARDAYKREAIIHPQVFKIVDGVGGGGDKFTQILGSDRWKEHTTENEDIDFHSPVQGWNTLVKYRTFSDGVNFSKNAVEDNVKNGEIGKTLKGYADTWGETYRNEQEIFGGKIFAFGGATSGNAIYQNSWGSETQTYANLFPDNKPFFNLTGNARTTKGGNTYYNAISSGALTPVNFRTLYNLVSDTNSFSEQDQRIMNKPDTLMVGTSDDYLTALQITKSDKLPNSQLNDTNVYKGLVSALFWPFLVWNASDTGYYIGKAKSELLQWHNRQKPVIEFFRRQENRGYRATVDARWGVLIKPGAWKTWGRTGGRFTSTVT